VGVGGNQGWDTTALGQREKNKKIEEEKREGKLSVHVMHELQKELMNTTPAGQNNKKNYLVGCKRNFQHLWEEAKGPTV